MSTSFDDIQENFALLDEWEDRYRYLIELGRQLPDMPEELKTDRNKVRGCASQVWLSSTKKNGSLRFQGDSDAHIVRGLIAILFSIYDEQTSAQILKTDAQNCFAKLGLSEHLTPQRSNGFASMVERIRADANEHLAAADSGCERAG